MYSEKDLALLQEKGLTVEVLDQQISYFKNGIDFVNIIRPAIPGEGISVLNDQEVMFYADLFDKKMQDFSLTRFIPASGAASRMFKALFEALEHLMGKDSDTEELLSSSKDLSMFFQNIEEYPFYDDLEHFLPESIDYQSLKRNDLILILKNLLESEGLNYGSMPKGLLKFHSYEKGNKTAFEEHFYEALRYLKNKTSDLKLHFTVSPEHRQLFSELSEKLCTFFEKENRVHFKIGFSEQKSATDTIAVDTQNEIFRNEDGSMLFRPGGHGALLENLNDLKEKIVFIGNIDNISPERAVSNRVKYKKLLGGFLIEKIGITHSLLKQLSKSEISDELREKAIEFIREISPESVNELLVMDEDDFKSHCHKILNRPVRICGMVKNVGEPGGGPFWVKNKRGELSKQIIESSQINMDNTEQKSHFQSATHFNPVDLACYIYDYTGKKFDLLDFRDPDMGFISKKSQGGKDLKALELPGLWNGAMAGWLTWFVDVPIETFTPVKTVFDLVREAHFDKLSER